MLKDSKAFSSFAVRDLEAARKFYSQTLGVDVSDVQGMKGILQLNLSGGAKVLVYPKPDHAAWSFGPRLLEHARGSYVEVDLIIPEFVRNEEPWTNLPWFPHYDPARQGEKTWLYQTGKAAFVLIFPKTVTKEP